MFRTIDNIATGSNPDDRVKKLEAQVTELKKTVGDQQERIEEIAELKKTVEDLQKRMDDLEKWPGTGDEPILKMFQDAEAQEAQETKTEDAEAPDAKAEDTGAPDTKAEDTEAPDAKADDLAESST